jgi:hypothetical protein
METSRLHSDTPHSVGLLWMSGQSKSETSTLQHKTRTRDKHPCLRGELNSQTQALDRVATGIDPELIFTLNIAC